MQPIIRVKNVSKRFSYWDDRPTSIKSILTLLLQGKFKFNHKNVLKVLENINFDIFPGQFVGIMGRNGVGKSTLLKLICGIYTPTQGSIEVHAQIAPLIELGAGFAGDLSGYENIFLNASILGLGYKATLDALPAILSFSELEEKIHMPVKNYSSGMLVRLGFAIASHLPFPIILIDEILAVGDLGFQEKCIKKIQELHQAGRTLVLITHSPEAIKNYCERCIIIDKQGITYDGPADAGAQLYINLMKSTQNS